MNTCYARDELLQRNIRDITDRVDLPASQAQLQALASGGAEQQMNKHYLRKDERGLRVHERVSSIHDAAGRPASLLFLSFELSVGADKP